MSAVHDQIRGYINDQFLFEADPSAVPLDASLFGNGMLDSAHMVDLVLYLEKTFAIRISSMDITPENFDTINRMAAYVLRMRGSNEDTRCPASSSAK